MTILILIIIFIMILLNIVKNSKFFFCSYKECINIKIPYFNNNINIYIYIYINIIIYINKLLYGIFIF
jgi:hypothetical protein